MASIASERKSVSPTQPQPPYFTLAEFEKIAELLPERRLELLKGELKVFPPPDREHQNLVSQFIELCAPYINEIKALGCRLAGSNYYLEVPESFLNAEGAGPSDVNPDAMICFRALTTTRQNPPALLVVEVLSFSNQENKERDLVTKVEIYAALEIPAYWVIDRRDQSVRVHTQPRQGRYNKVEQCYEKTVLAAPGLEFLRITPAQLFAE